MKKNLEIATVYPVLFLIIIFMPNIFGKDLQKYNYFMNGEKNYYLTN